MKKIFVFIHVIFALALWGQKPIVVSSKVEQATVYFDAVELTHKSSVNFTKGTYQIVVQNVSNTLDVNTVQALFPKGVSMLSTQFFIKNSEEGVQSNTPYYRQLKDSIALVDLELNRVRNRKNSEQKTVENLDIAQSELKGLTTINTAEYVKLVDFYTSKRTSLLNQIDVLGKEEQNLKRILEGLNHQMTLNFPETYQKNKGEMVIRVMSDIEQKADIYLTYVSRSASWYPTYDLRTDNINNPLVLLYKANVTQRTGVNWEKVQMVLSSGAIGSFNEKPNLYPWHLSYYDVNQYPRAALQEVVLTEVAYTAKVQAEETADMVDGYQQVNEYVAMQDGSLTTSFDIKVKYDVQSNGKEHSVVLQELNIPAVYKYYATPKAKNAFLMAEVDHYSQYGLLSGQADVIIEGMYVGKTFLEPNQNQEKLEVTMGVDKKIAISKEKIADKSGTKFLSSYKEQTFTYDIILRNNKKENVSVMLEDQYPLSTNKQVTVELLEVSNPKNNDKEKGLLSWNVSLSPGEVKKIRLSYKVKHPKNMSITNL
ncbi:MAG: DUF4139 domain-containing protein [Bacteroidota bacterium]|nr:DUF4139 domain-containing protein [Bacteroidota bacterium]